jgi:hypothetical protein
VSPAGKWTELEIIRFRKIRHRKVGVTFSLLRRNLKKEKGRLICKQEGYWKRGVNGGEERREGKRGQEGRHD